MAATEDFKMSEHLINYLQNQVEDLSFVDNAANLKKYICCACGNVAISHCIANCRDVFCTKCYQKFYKKSCPDCEFTVLTNGQNKDFEKAVFELKIKCKFENNGCTEIVLLKNYLKHIGLCKFAPERILPKLYRVDQTAKAIDQLKNDVYQIKESMHLIKTEILQIKNEQDVGNKRIYEEIRGMMQKLTDATESMQTEIRKVVQQCKKSDNELKNENQREIQNLESRIQEGQQALKEKKKKKIQKIQLANKEEIQKLESIIEVGQQALKDENKKEVQKIQLENKENIQKLESRIQALKEENKKEIQKIQLENNEAIQTLESIIQVEQHTLNEENKKEIQKIQLENNDEIQTLESIIEVGQQALKDENKKEVQKIQLENKGDIQKLESRIQAGKQALKEENKKEIQKIQLENKENIQKLESRIQALKEENKKEIQKIQLENNEAIQTLESIIQVDQHALKEEHEEDIQKVQLENIEELRKVESEQKIRLKELQTELDVLQLLWEDHFGYEPPGIYLWKVPEFQKKLQAFMGKDKVTFRSETSFNVPNGLQFNPDLYTGAGQYIHIDINFTTDIHTVDGKLSVPYLHSRKYVMLDQSAAAIKDNVEMIDRPNFKMNSAKDMLIESFKNSRFFPINFLKSENNYIKNDQILIKIVLEPIALLWKQISINDGNFLLRINDYSRKKQDEINGLRYKLLSKPFKTSHAGYTMQVETYLNGEGAAKGKYISMFIQVILGEHDDLLPLPFNCKFNFCLLDQSDSLTKENISKEFNYEFEEGSLIIGPDSFVLQSTAEDPKYLRNDSLSLQITVEIL